MWWGTAGSPGTKSGCSIVLCCAAPPNLVCYQSTMCRPPTTQLHTHTSLNTFHWLPSPHLWTLSAIAQFTASPSKQTGSSTQGQTQCITAESFFQSLLWAIRPRLRNTDVVLVNHRCLNCTNLRLNCTALQYTVEALLILITIIY